MHPTPRYKNAVALSYDGKELLTPEVSVTSETLPADVIVSIAKRYGIPIVKKPFLARVLSGLPQGSFIPEQLYTAVALILAEVLRLKMDVKPQ